MRLRVFLPTSVLVDAATTAITADGAHGSFGLLPRHIDCVAALTPGILTFIDAAGEEQYLALDGGILVKCGDEVRVVTGHAVRGDALADLRAVVETTFRQVAERERSARAVLAHLEADLVRGLVREQRGA
jgi:F-type H+-transporting ATPase subunit epsilon